MLIGTPLYMSPEQCRGLDVDSRSDLFSTGVVLYELLTGEKPFRGNMEQITYKICHEEPEPPSRLSKLRLPSAVDQLVATALAKDPAARFQDAHAFRDSLREVAQLSVEVEDGAGTTMMAIGTLRLQKPAPAWDDETLATAERELARALGPMAKVIVHRAAAQASDRAELCSILSDSIMDPDTRRQFVQAFERTAGSGVRTGGGTSGSQSAAQSRQRTGGHASISGASQRCDRPRPAARPGLHRPDHGAARGVHRAHRADRDEESRARREGPARFPAARGRQSRHAGARRVPARSRPVESLSARRGAGSPPRAARCSRCPA